MWTIIVYTSAHNCVDLSLVYIDVDVFAFMWMKGKHFCGCYVDISVENICTFMRMKGTHVCGFYVHISVDNICTFMGTKATHFCKFCYITLHYIINFLTWPK